MRGDAIPDIAHRRTGGTNNAWSASGVSIQKSECGVLFNLFRKPFKGWANYQEMQRCAFQFFNGEDYMHPLFQRIVLTQTGYQPPPEYGTPEHQQQTWNALPSSKLWTRERTTAKFSRWYTFNIKSKAIRPFLGEMYMVLLLICITKGIIKSSADIPGMDVDIEWLASMLPEQGI